MASLLIDRKLIYGHGAQVFVRAQNRSGATVNPGDVVILDTTNSTSSLVAFTTTTAQDDPLLLGMANQKIADKDEGEIQLEGPTNLLKVNGTTAIVKGDYLSTFTSAGIAAKRSAVTKPGIFAIALEAYAVADSLGVIDAWLFRPDRIDASGTAITYGTAGQMAADGLAAANAAGSTAATARIDHAHANTADTPALTFGTTNSAGTAGSVLAADATIAIFDATVPTTIGPDDSAAVGTAAFAARRDHRHAITGAAPSDGSLTTANAEGSASSFSRSDHTHKSILLNDVPLILGTTDATATAGRLEYDTAETNDCLKLGLDTTTRRLIICDYADMGSDSALAVATDPEVVIYDNTFAAYIRFRATTAGGFIDVVTGDAIAFQVNSVTEFSMDATSLIIASGNLIDFDAAQGSYANLMRDVNNNELLDTQAVASAVNQMGITNAATGNAPAFESRGGDANIGIKLAPKGTGAVEIDNGTDPVALRMYGVQGGYNNVLTDVNGNEVLLFQGVASAVNELGFTNAATTANPSLVASGGDANVGINYTAKGTGAHVFDNGTDPVIIQMQGAAAGANNVIQDVNGLELLILWPIADAVNELTIRNAATTNNPSILASGETNVSLDIISKGTGSVRLLGGSTVLMRLNTSSIDFRAQTVSGGDGSAGDFTLQSTTHGTKGAIVIANADGGLKVGGTANPATTVGTNKIMLYTGTAPGGTIASGGALYVAVATNTELNYLDSAGNVQQLSTT